MSCLDCLDRWLMIGWLLHVWCINSMQSGYFWPVWLRYATLAKGGILGVSRTGHVANSRFPTSEHESEGRHTLVYACFTAEREKKKGKGGHCLLVWGLFIPLFIAPLSACVSVRSFLMVTIPGRDTHPMPVYWHAWRGQFRAQRKTLPIVPILAIYRAFGSGVLGIFGAYILGHFWRGEFILFGAWPSISSRMCSSLIL